MKVLHLGETITGDGGAIAIHRLHCGLRNAGIDSRILCAIKTIESPDITEFNPFKSKVGNKIDSLMRHFSSAVGLNSLFDLNSFKMTGDQTYLESDILTIHAATYGFFSPLVIPSLTKNKPALLVLHDMWNFTGHCSYSFDCSRWKTGCGKCPHLDIPPAIRRDASRLAWKLKDWSYSRSHLTVVTPSIWMTELAQQSMLNRFPIHRIPYGIDTETYQPFDAELCRSALGVPQGKKVLLFVAADLTRHRKGGDLLLEALQRLPRALREETVLLLLGNKGESLAGALGMPGISLGFIGNDRLKALCYSAADLFLHPARAENLPYVILESMACGTPVVSFRVGGIPDLVRPGITGHLAEPENASEFSNYIAQILEDKSTRHDMGQQCREMVLREFAVDLQVQRYINLYSRLLDKPVMTA